MRHGNLTRDEAIELVGLNAVVAVEDENCEPTSRCQTDGDTDVEFAASVACKTADGDDCVLTAYYYVGGEWMANLPDDVWYGDLVDWEINGYEVC